MISKSEVTSYSVLLKSSRVGIFNDAQTDPMIIIHPVWMSAWSISQHLKASRKFWRLQNNNRTHLCASL